MSIVIPNRSERKYETYPDYNNSGIEWLGEVPSHWGVKKLKYLCSRSAIYGANEAANSYNETGIRFLRTSDIDDNGDLLNDSPVYIDPISVQDYRLINGDLLVSRSGTLGRSFLYDNKLHGECAYAGYLVRFVPNNKLVPKFAFYFTKSATFIDWLQVSVIQSTIGNVNGQKYANMPMPTPDVTEQQAITDFLDSETTRIDELIARKQRLIELLQEQRTALITRIVTKGLNPDVPMKDSGVEWLGEIPAHWEVKKLKRLGWFQAGAGFPDNEQGLQDEDLPFYKVSDMNLEGNDILMTTYNNSVSRDTAKRLGATVFPKGTIIFPKVGIALLTNKRRILTCDACMDNNTMGFFVKLGTVKYLYYRLLTLDFGRLANPGAVPSMNESQACNIETDVPSLPEQQAISDFLDQETSRIDSLVGRINQAIEKLQEYRSALITAAVTGKIDVRQYVS